MSLITFCLLRPACHLPSSRLQLLVLLHHQRHQTELDAVTRSHIFLLHVTSRSLQQRLLLQLLQDQGAGVVGTCRR